MRHSARSALLVSVGFYSSACASDPQANEAATAEASAEVSDAAGESSSESGGTASESESAGDGDGDGDPLAPLSDEFDELSRLSQWSRRHEVEGEPAQFSQLDQVGGRLEFQPTTSGWYGDFDGPFFYKMVSGDFVVETWVEADDRDGVGGPPEELFNSAGLLARDPAHAPGVENWIMHNVGLQNGEVATEGKTTVDSISVLTLVPGANRGVLRICRQGEELTLARRLEGETEFTETHVFPRADFPEELQVGMIVNGWNSGGTTPDTTRTPDLLARFDYVRFWTPSGLGACSAEVP